MVELEQMYKTTQCETSQWLIKYKSMMNAGDKKKNCYANGDASLGDRKHPGPIAKLCQRKHQVRKRTRFTGRSVRRLRDNITLRLMCGIRAVEDASDEESDE